jgi:hypothetical protein
MTNLLDDILGELFPKPKGPIPLTEFGQLKNRVENITNKLLKLQTNMQTLKKIILRQDKELEDLKKADHKLTFKQRMDLVTKVKDDFDELVVGGRLWLSEENMMKVFPDINPAPFLGPCTIRHHPKERTFSVVKE